MLSCVRADIRRTMPMTYYIKMEHFDGSVEEGLRIRIPMELDVRFPVRLLPTLQKAFRWKKV